MSIFSSVKMQRPKLNKFDLSHEKKFTCNMGPLYPIMLQEIIPGDHFRVSSEIMMRLAPMVAPIMHRVNATVHFFFVPNRLVWDEWEDFITGGRLGTDAPVFPHILYKNGEPDFNDGVNFVGQGTIWDFFGLPTLSSSPSTDTVGQKINALPFRAYQLIWNEYFRDQNLTAPVEFSKASGKVSTTGFPGTYDRKTIMTLRSRCWEKDYLTSALPFTQRGPEALIPMEGSADVTYRDVPSVWRDGVGNIPHAGTPKFDGTTAAFLDNNGVDPIGPIENIDTVDFANTNVTINDLRRAIKLQEWLEKNARGGGRYVEQLLAHFGVISPDARLQRPEYLGGGQTPVVISEVLSTVQSFADNTDPSGSATSPAQGNMSGHGISVGKTNTFSRKFTEHGYVIGLLSILPRTAYQQGIPRHFSYADKFDYYFPEFAHLGEQGILNKEVFYQPALLSANDSTFGYTPRYSHMKFTPSTVHGDMRTNLNYWHMARIFAGGAVPLNTAFVTADPTDRIFSVIDPGLDHLYVQLFNKVDALRPMPYFGTPRL